MNKSGLYTWSVLLSPLAWLYGVVIWIRNWLYDNGILISTGFNMPVISVGNITVGGTGKTPHVEYLVQLLLEDEMRIATLSRGYKRKTRDFRIASSNSSARDMGDEPMQVKLRFPGITVAVDRKRVNGIQNLMKLAPPIEVILLDDAYQHRSLKPGFSILLIDYNRPIDKDLLLPAGRLREPANNRNRANIILVTRSPERIKPIELREYVNRLEPSIGQHIYFTSMKYGDLLPVYPQVPVKELSWFKEHTQKILIVSGIANPRHLRQYARSINTNISEISFPDHHNYSRKDLNQISQRFTELSKNNTQVMVLTTEKDATRLREHIPDQALKDAVYAIRIHVHFLQDDKEEFDRQIRDYVISNKRSSILYKEED
jgi:tetraacyldisaccharide 4'-kinase